jgi:hypothetical protein
MAIEKVLLDEETVEELVTSWMDDNLDVLETLEDWTDAPDEEALLEVATDAAVGLIEGLKNPADGEPAYEITNPVEQLAESFLRALVYETSPSDEDYDAWEAEYDEAVEAEEQVEDAYYASRDEE